MPAPPAVAAAARALQAGDPLAALRQVALRRDATGLALRGIAMAQLGELDAARRLLRRAARAFGPAAPLARARCATAEAEIALAARGPAGPPGALEDAARALEAGGDRANAVHARLLAVRRLVLAGRVAEADRALGRLDLRGAPPALAAVAGLAALDVALRSGQGAAAADAHARARRAAARARIPALAAEVERAGHALASPAARLLSAGAERPLRLDEVEALRRGDRLLVDGCRRSAGRGGAGVDLARRPVLFALLRALAEAWPGDASREALVRRAFGAARASPSLRGRLRVEVARLRRALRGLASVRATPAGFALAPRAGAGVAVLAPPAAAGDADGHAAALAALLADGQGWSSSALALALGASRRTVQRGLTVLAERGAVRALGRGRARRWVAAPVSGFNPALLLPLPRAIGQG
ncbi:helix-turn-helix domain-containing protein [Anaeromyxobacter sp. Red801]|uniref:helix-turn-helix domain-containing protein n=1 Tax=Anaeromyxobacter sp. Red801 TaxID=3411632 RepID=UPI003BA1932D